MTIRVIREIRGPTKLKTDDKCFLLNTNHTNLTNLASRYALATIRNETGQT